jgi:predicted transcriptional regulator of viral defense system
MRLPTGRGGNAVGKYDESLKVLPHLGDVKLGMSKHGMSTSEFAAHLGIRRNNARQLLQRWYEKRWVTRVMSGRGWHWFRLN